MLLSKRVRIFFLIVSFLLLTAKGEEEYPSYDEADNETMVVEFPYDRNNTNTFASITFIAQEDMTNLTVCFAFMVNALKSAERDQMQLLQLQDSDGETLAEIKFSVENDESTSFEFGSGTESYSHSDTKMSE